MILGVSICDNGGDNELVGVNCGSGDCIVGVSCPCDRVCACICACDGD